MDFKNDFKNIFISTFEPVMTQMGFTRSNKVFSRLVNGKFVHIFSYLFFGRETFTMTFSISALCLGGGYSLRYCDDFRMCEVFKVGEFDNIPERYAEYMIQSLELAQRHVFPLFCEAVDYAAYLKVMNRLHFDNIKIEENYIVNLILGNYEISKKSKEAYISSVIETCRINWGTDYPIVSDNRKRFEEECNHYYKMKEAMDSNNREYIEEYIKQLERTSLDNYIREFYGKRKHSKYLEIGILPFDVVNI